MKRLERRPPYAYEFSKGTPPQLHVLQGESFVLETEDSLSGGVRSRRQLRSLARLPGRDSTPPLANPLSGPVFVEGAEPGDLLEVTVEDIAVDSQGQLVFLPDSVPAEFRARWPELGEPSISIFKHATPWPGRSSKPEIVVDDATRWPLAPMIGTIGVAPDREVESSATGQGPWGGNLDCKDIRKGVTVQLNCYHNGGLLSVGDVHGSQGDTEFCGGADETRASVKLSCRVVKRRRIPFPRLDTEDSLVALCSDKPLESAVMGAVLNLADWLVGEHGYTPRQFCLHASANPDFRIRVYQMARVDRIRYTVGAELPKSYLVGSRGPRA
jgi:acetamidase/formamidase